MAIRALSRDSGAESLTPVPVRLVQQVEFCQFCSNRGCRAAQEFRRDQPWRCRCLGASPRRRSARRGGVEPSGSNNRCRGWIRSPPLGPNPQYAHSPTGCHVVPWSMDRSCETVDSPPVVPPARCWAARTGEPRAGPVSAPASNA